MNWGRTKGITNPVMANCSKQEGKEEKPQVVTERMRKYRGAEGRVRMELTSPVWEPTGLSTERFKFTSALVKAQSRPIPSWNILLGCPL